MTTITMNGRWTMRRDPHTEVRILCVDAPGDYPVVYIDHNGDITTTTLDGTFDRAHRDRGRDGPRDLVPYIEPRKPVSGWVNVDTDGYRSDIFSSKATADNYARSNRIACVYVTETDPPEDV